MESKTALRDGSPDGCCNGLPALREEDRREALAASGGGSPSLGMVQHPGNAPELLGAQTRAKSRAVLRLLVGRLGRFCSRLFGVALTRPPRIFGYARISPLDGDSQAQIEDLRSAGAERLYIDKAAAADERPALGRALADVRPGDVLVIWSLTRLGQSLPHLLQVMEDLRARQVEVRSILEDITAVRAAAELLALSARFMRSERSLIASQKRSQQARHWGRPSAFNDPARLAEAQKLLADNKLTKAEVAKRVGVSPATLYRWFPVANPEKRGPGRPRKDQRKSPITQEGMV